jgi:acyl-coenzyme A synthetase/AMP-(fatty) acid ligase/D-alanine-D-alanine ligase-like ATP-grasp enzyme
MNLANELSRQAQLRPDATAIHLLKGTLSFRRLEELTWRAATFLHRNGVKAGDAVALTFASELALLVTMLATARIGATVFSLPRNSPPMLRAEMAAGAGARILATDCADADGAGLARLPVDIDALSKVEAPIDVNVRVDSPQAPWLIITGSGSTGRPKLFPVTHAQFHARISLTGESISLSQNDRYASLPHLDFTSPKVKCLAALFAGAAVVLFDRSQLNPVVLCREYRVSILDATVFHVEQILAALTGDAKDMLGSLRVLLVGSSTVSDGLRRRVLKTLSQALYIHYGTTESGLLAIAGPKDVLSPPETVGRPPAGVSVEVVDAGGQALPPGKIGQIRAKSPGMIDRYLDDEQATQLAFKDGWFMPGDLGKFTPDGCLVYCGRADHMMIMNGINIYPAEIERVITGHPAVRDAAAVPLRSTVHQDIPVCAVVLRNAPHATENELLDFTRQRLGSHGPRRIVVLEHIPRNEQGKLIRPQLMHDIAGKLRTRIRTAEKDNALLQDSNEMTTLRQPMRQAAQQPLRQPMRQFKINLNCPAPVDLDSIDGWLKSALAIEIYPCNCSIAQAGHSSRTLMPGLIWRILLLIRDLLQSARIPAFDPGRVLRIEQDQKRLSNWTATVAVVNIDHIPPRCYAIAIEEAVKIVLWAMGRARTPENVANLYGMIEKQVIQPLRKMIIAGKSTIPVLRAAYRQNIPFSHLGAGIYQLGWGSKSRRMDRSTTESDSAIGSKMAQNKVWAANLIRMAGLPAPEHGVVAAKEDALRVARHLGWPVVVKPVNRDRGEGVTVGVTDEKQLLAALKTAKAKQVIIEREVAGVCHRLFIANEQLLYAVKRLPKSIKGDGRRTVAELIRESNQVEKNRPPWLRSELFPDDSLAIEAVTNAGFAFDSVPREGELVPLRKIESTQWGGVDEDVADCIHPDNLDIALRAAALFGLNVAGIDIITPDISKPWHANGAIINEVNFAPLFGGGEISRNHIPIFLKKFMNGDGRIPVEAFVGGDTALDSARERQKELIGQGIKCALTSHKTTLTSSGEETHFPFQSLFNRCRALLMNGQIEAIVLAIQTDEFLRTGLPVDRIDRITTAAGELAAWNSPNEKLPRSRVESLLALLRNQAPAAWKSP